MGRGARLGWSLHNGAYPTLQANVKQATTYPLLFCQPLLVPSDHLGGFGGNQQLIIPVMGVFLDLTRHDMEIVATADTWYR